MEITVIDDSDHVGWLAGFFRIGEVYMKDVNTMVANVLKKVGTKRIRRLNILDHGNKHAIQIGSDVITLKNLNKYKPALRRLTPKFHTLGGVHLQHCHVGQNERLLIELSKLWDVAVWAGTGAHNPIYRFNWGSYVVCFPDATCLRKMGRP